MTTETQGTDAANANTEPRIVVAPPWMLVAMRHLGEHEVLGGADNPRIVEWLAGTGLLHQRDETAWCSAFVNACMREAGIAGTGKANARSWLSWGRPSPTPQLGCVVIFDRPPNPVSGHVALYAGETRTTIWVLGGNQGNRVSYAEYPRARWLGYRLAP